MFEIAWAALLSGAPLEQKRLRDELRVYRSAAVLAIFAHLPEFFYRRKPSCLLWRPDRGHALGERVEAD